MSALALDTHLIARIGAQVPQKSGFAALARARAFARLQDMGLPRPRDEYWRYSNPEVLNAAASEPLRALHSEAPLAAGLNPLTITFCDGIFDADASDDLAIGGGQITLLSRAGDIHFAQDLYGALEECGQTPVARPFAALNTVQASEGVLLHVTGQISRPILINYTSKTYTSDVMLHHCIKLEAGAEATFIEQGICGARSNIVIEADLAAGAKLHHIRTQTSADDAVAIAHVFARIAQNAAFKSFGLCAHGRMIRNEAVIELVGDDAAAHVAGATLGDGGDHHDDTVFITHQGRGCESRQVFKNVLKNGAVGVFQGKILVRQAAQKTDGYQISQALLLEGDSQFLTKPELEIYADDVKCSHGSTSGAMDETALFYLQSRGVPRAQAQALLVLAFMAEALEEIADPAIAEDIRARMESLLQRARS
jgi:Fe-S cluster assembly protein SufD